MILISKAFQLSFGSTYKSILNCFLERWSDRIWWPGCLFELSGSGHSGWSRDSVQVETEWWWWLSITILISIYSFCPDIRWFRIRIWYYRWTDVLMIFQPWLLSTDPWWRIAKKMISTCRSILNDLTNCDWCWLTWRFWQDISWWYPCQWYWGRNGRRFYVHRIAKTSTLVFDLSLW